MLTGKPIPVAIVLNSFDVGGTEHQMTELICRLDRRRFRVHAACLGDRGALRSRVVAAQVPITEFPMRGFAKPATALQAVRFARWCARTGICVVHACDYYANVFAMAAAALARVPVRVASRRDVFVPERTPAHLRLQHAAYHLAHRIVANSSAAGARLVEEGIAPDKVVQIPNGLDLQRFEGGARGTRSGRLVVTVANLRPGKGHEVLLEAAPRVLAQAPDVRFRIVGDGPRRRELEWQAARLGIADRVDFAGHCEDVAQVLASADVFAFPSHMEASPNAVIEAMAAGVPIVATNVGGIPEAVTDGDTGLLVEAGRAEALAEAILRLLDAPALAGRLAERAREAARTRYSFERMVADFERLYVSELTARGVLQPTRGAARATAA